jgi:hypothetical protein
VGPNLAVTHGTEHRSISIKHSSIFSFLDGTVKLFIVLFGWVDGRWCSAATHARHSKRAASKAIDGLHERKCYETRKPSAFRIRWWWRTYANGVGWIQKQVITYTIWSRETINNISHNKSAERRWGYTSVANNLKFCTSAWNVIDRSVSIAGIIR